MNSFKVLKNFRDSQNEMSLHQEGENVELSAKRGDELTEKGFVCPVDTKVEKEEKEKEDSESITKVEKESTKGVSKTQKAQG